MGFLPHVLKDLMFKFKGIITAWFGHWWISIQLGLASNEKLSSATWLASNEKLSSATWIAWMELSDHPSGTKPRAASTTDFLFLGEKIPTLCYQKNLGQRPSNGKKENRFFLHFLAKYCIWKKLCSLSLETWPVALCQ
jgi:hypothetical protein